MTPEWCCRTVTCGYEWDIATPHPTEEMMERLRREVDRQQRQLNKAWDRESELEKKLRFEEEGRRNDQTQLEALRLKADRSESRLQSKEAEARLDGKKRARGGWFAFGGFFLSFVVGMQLAPGSSYGVLWRAIIVSVIAYFVGKDWASRGDWTN